MRAACILIAHVAVRLERRDRPELKRIPVVVGGAPGERRAVLDCSPEAVRQGVRPGMALRQALALCRDAAFVDPRPALYAKTCSAILDALEGFSPRVQAAEPGCAFLDLDGTDQLWPDEPALARGLHDAVRAACRLTPQIGFADGMFAARAAARTAGDGYWVMGNGNGSRSPGLHSTPSITHHPPPTTHIVPPGSTTRFLAHLSVDVLPVSAEMRRRLGLFGIRTLGELAALPVGAVQAQFGREGPRAWRLAAGIDEDQLIPRVHAEAPEERLELPAPTADRGTLERATGLLLRRLFRRPDLGTRLARRLHIRITLEDGRAWERMITFQDATADPDTALFAVRTRLEALDLPAAAVTLTITLHDLCGERGRQERMFTTHGRRVAQLDEAISRLRASLGAAPVFRLVEIEPWSRIPERRNALTEYDR